MRGKFFAKYCLIKTYFQLISSVIKQGNYFPLFKNPSLSSQLKYSSAPLSNEWPFIQPHFWPHTEESQIYIYHLEFSPKLHKLIASSLQVLPFYCSIASLHSYMQYTNMYQICTKVNFFFKIYFIEVQLIYIVVLNFCYPMK